MLFVLVIFLVLAAGLHFGAIYNGQQGYVLINTDTVTYETTVTALIVGVVLLCILVLVLATLMQKGLSSFNSVLNWFSFRKKANARKSFIAGLTDMMEGNWDKAEAKFVKYAVYHDSPELCFIFASEAAHQQQKNILREKYIKLSMEHNSQFPASRISHARHLIALEKYDQAEKVLKTLSKKHQKNSVVLVLYKEIYRNALMWSELATLLPKLKKSRALSISELERLEQDIYLSQLKKEGLAASDILIAWNTFPTAFKKTDVAIESMISVSFPHQQKQQIQDVLLSLIMRHPTEQNLAILSKMQIIDISPTIKSLNRLADEHKTNATFLSVLGKLQLQNKDFADAQVSLESALRQRIDFQDYALLSQALEHQDKKDAAQEVSNKMMELMVK